jgi:hypothetical protein
MKVAKDSKNDMVWWRESENVNETESENENSISEMDEIRQVLRLSCVQVLEIRQVFHELTPILGLKLRSQLRLFK